MSCQLFVRLLGMLSNGSEGSVGATEGAKPTEAADESVGSQLPVGEQSASADVKAQPPSQSVEVVKTVGASAETTKQVSAEAKHVPSAEGTDGSEAKLNVDEPKLGTEKLETTSEPPVEGTKLETTSEPPVEGTKLETTSEPPVEGKHETSLPEGKHETDSSTTEGKHETDSSTTEGKHETDSSTTEGKHETNGGAEGERDPNVVETAEPVPSAEGKQVEPTSPPSAELNESKPSEEVNEFVEVEGFTDGESEGAKLPSELNPSDAKLLAKQLKEAKRTINRKRNSSDVDETLSEAFEVETDSQIKPNKKSKVKRVKPKRKLVTPPEC
ncbi:MAG: hypothetical protein ACKEQI_00420 [Candidatus Hodgkinia cicadicola]